MNCGNKDATAVTVTSKEHKSRCSHCTGRITEITENRHFIGSRVVIQHGILSKLPVQCTDTSRQSAKENLRLICLQNLLVHEACRTCCHSLHRLPGFL